VPDVESSIFSPAENRMPERDQWFRGALLYPAPYVLYILLASLDIIFTWTILHAGGQELNVIADWIIRRYDRVGVVVFKFLTLVLVVIICETVGRRDRALGQKLAYWAVALTAFPVVVGMVHLLAALRARTEP
jgi:hypothetical protein